jgi:hypothetical protein
VTGSGPVTCGIGVVALAGPAARNASASADAIPSDTREQWRSTVTSSLVKR